MHFNLEHKSQPGNEFLSPLFEKCGGSKVHSPPKIVGLTWMTSSLGALNGQADCCEQLGVV